MECDVVVVGSGVAGNVAAYYLGRSGLNVVLINKNENLEESNTYYAQGGIVYEGENDSAELRYQDVMNAGAGICNPDAVRIVSDEGPQRVLETLIRDFNVGFSRNAQGELDLTEEGAHSRKRILYSFDTTGKSIEESAIQAIKKIPNITLLSDFTVIDIITWDHHSTDKFRMYKPLTALGVYGLNNATKKVEKILAKTVIIASGGMGQVYRHTTNPSSTTGDGYAMAWRAGARLINMEYTQFHPTSLYHARANNFLISEAVRGEGAILMNHKNEAFMSKYHNLKELAPRDIVTRAILNEMIENDDVYEYLDLSAMGKDTIRNRFPNIYKTLLSYGLDITEEMIPVVPAFHFSCGGILVDMMGRTTIERLFAVGEVACTGLHGANRLASTSLLEGVVFARRISEYIELNRNYYMNFEFPEVPEWIDTGIADSIDPALIQQDWTLLKNIMWNYVGPVRSRKRLRRAMIDLKNLSEDIENFYRDSKIDRRIIELRNAVQTGAIVAESAWTNRHSLGAHFRID